MRGHSSTPLATCSPIHLRRWFASPLRQAILAAGVVLSGLAGCDSGYYGGYYWQPAGSVPYSGRTAISWTVNGTALTVDRCKTERIDSLTVQFVSDQDRQSVAEFREVECDLTRYSAAMVPIGPISIYVSAIHQQRQTECIRYAGIGRGTATDKFPTDALPIDLKTVASCQ